MYQVAPGGILFLDLSKSGTGWAAGSDLTRCPAWGVWKFSGLLGPVFGGLENELADAIAEMKPRLVGMEAPLAANQQTDAHSAEILIGLAAIAEATCWRWDVPLTRHSSGTLRSQVCGRAHRTDEERHAKQNVKDLIVKPWVESMGWDIPDHNARDACVGLAYLLGYRFPRAGKKVAA